MFQMYPDRGYEWFTEVDVRYEGGEKGFAETTDELINQLKLLIVALEEMERRRWE